jgi:hypothetical protein
MIKIADGSLSSITQARGCTVLLFNNASGLLRYHFRVGKSGSPTSHVNDVIRLAFQLFCLGHDIHDKKDVNLVALLEIIVSPSGWEILIIAIPKFSQL